MEKTEAVDKNEFSNRRRHARIPADAPVELYGTDKRPLMLGPDLLDIHDRGFGLKLCDRLEPGEILSFKIRLPSGLIRGRARVCWLKTRLVGYQCGLEIQSMGRLHSYRLDQFLNPKAVSLITAGDVILALAALAVSYLVLADWLGWRLLGRP